MEIAAVMKQVFYGDPFVMRMCHQHFHLIAAQDAALGEEGHWEKCRLGTSAIFPCCLTEKIGQLSGLSRGSFPMCQAEVLKVAADNCVDDIG